MSKRRRSRTQSLFRIGTIFKVLGTEPAGETSSDGLVDPPRSIDASSVDNIEHRVVVRAGKSHCLALPIRTYDHPGVSTTLRSTGDLVPLVAKCHTQNAPSESGLARRPLHVIPEDQTDELDTNLHIDCTRIYTIEYNVRVSTVGHIVPEDLPYLDRCAQKIWMNEGLNASPEMRTPPHGRAAEFALGWLDGSGVISRSEDDEGPTKTFVPPKVARQYFTQARLLSILEEVLPAESEPGRLARNIHEHGYHLVLLILLRMGKLSEIPHFLRQKVLSDTHLPFTSRKNFPHTVDFDDFCRGQEPFSVIPFRTDMEEDYTAESILPIIDKVLVNDGEGNAKIHRIQLHADFDEFSGGDTKVGRILSLHIIIS